MKALLPVLLLASLALPARAAWIELGEWFVAREGRGIAVHALGPAAPDAPTGPARAAGAPVVSRAALGPDDEVVLVRFRHEDPRPALRRLGSILAEAGGRVLLRVDSRGRALLRRIAGDHVEVQAAPWGTVLLRHHAARPARHLPPHAGLVARVSGDRWLADVETLVAFGTRSSRSEGYLAAAAWALERFQALGLEAASVPFQLGSAQVPNVIARLHPGEEGEARPIVLVGAHLDSIGGWGSDAAPGADDNASGSAGVLELARVLRELPADPGVELRFVLFGGEEQGLYGSRAVVSAMQAAGELARLKAVVIMDMIAFDQGGDLEVTLESRAFAQAEMDRMAGLGAVFTDLVISTTTDAWGSDHMPFLRKGVAAILPIEGEYDDNPHDHTSHDVVANLNRDLAVGILRMAAAYVLDSLD